MEDLNAPHSPKPHIREMIRELVHDIPTIDLIRLHDDMVGELEMLRAIIAVKNKLDKMRSK